MTHEFILATPAKKIFIVKRMVKVQVPRVVKKKIKVKKEVLIADLPLEKRPVATGDSGDRLLPLFTQVDEEQEYEETVVVEEDQMRAVSEEGAANVVRMSDAHNDRQHQRMFTHFVVGRYVDEKFEFPEKTDGLVFGGADYVKRGYQEMSDLDEKKLLLDVVGYFGWKGDFLEAAEPDGFHDSR